MSLRTIAALVAVVLAGCPAEKAPNVDADLAGAAQQTAPEADPAPASWRRYAPAGGALRLRHPPDWRVHHAHEGSVMEVVNVLPEAVAQRVELPLMIHAEADVTFVSVFPRAFGTDLPASRWKRVSPDTLGVELSLPIVEAESRALQLESGETWGLYLRLARPPPGWDDRAFVFAQIAVRDFQARCQREGEPIELDACDPMTGDDLRRFGRLDEAAQRNVLRVLSSLRFEASTATVTAEAQRLIEVDAPSPGQAIRSPLEIRGRAKGPWYFEGDFPIQLLDDKGREVAVAVATARGPWMTTSWVPFRATLTFEPPTSKRGTLIFRKDNASGRPELDAEHRVPVWFARPQ